MSESHNPIASVCIPTYCRYNLLRRAVASVLSQDFGPMEIIISDNASNDGSWERTAKLAELDPRIRVRRNDRNLGWTGNINNCIAEAKGKYIVFLCDDDELLPGMVNACADFLEANPAAGLVHTPAYYVGITGKQKPVTPEIKPLLKAGLEALNHTAFEFNIVFSATMARTECFRKLGPFKESISADYEMWARIATVYDVGYIREPLVRVYVHAISPKMTPERYISENEKLAQMVMALFPEAERKPEELRHKGKVQMVVAMRSLGVQSVQAGYWGNALAFFKAARDYSETYGLLGSAADLLLRGVPRRVYQLLKRKKAFETHV